MSTYTARRVHRDVKPRKCRSPRGDGSRCTLNALTGKPTCVVHTKSGTPHAKRCRCFRCAQRGRRKARP